VVFSILYVVVLKPLPWPASARLVQISESRRGGSNRLGAIAKNATYLAWRDHPATLESMAGWTVDTATFSDGIEPDRISVASVSATIFPLLGASPLVGALFTSQDESPTAGGPVVLSYALWQQKYGSSPGVLGRAVKINSEARRIVGVMPASFTTPDQDTRAWIPMYVPPVSDGKSDAKTISMVRHITNDYFAAMQIRMLAGRTFTAADSKSSQPVVIVNQAFADQYLEPPAVGRKIPAGEVVGVVDNVRQRSVTDPFQPDVYQAIAQLDKGEQYHMPRLVVRTAGPPVSLAPVMRALVREQDPGVALEDVTTMEDRLAASLAQPRMYTAWLGVFAFFALAVAAVGLFGVLSYSVAQRSREIGLRTALGTKPTDIVRLVLGQGLRMSLGGAAAGLALSFLLLKPLAALLYGVSAYDPWSYTVMILALLAVSTVACVIPARRASKLDPMRVLRA
jgi:hypothetical protein